MMTLAFIVLSAAAADVQVNVLVVRVQPVYDALAKTVPVMVLVRK